MEEFPCLHCGTFFLPRNRNQQFCSTKPCQKARKRYWQREKIRDDPEYRASQRLSNKKWHKGNPGYWKRYREKNPDKAERNRILQRIRNKKPTSTQTIIAKMDASKSIAEGLSGYYWLVPEIAKMDAAKIYIHAISNSCKQLQRWT